MTWITGENPSAKEEHIDYNKLFAETLKGELDEDTARRTLGKFLMYNVGLMVWILTGFILEPYQRIMIKGWMKKNFTLCIAGRGFGKSMVWSHFCYLYCLTHPDHHIIMVSATFRSSRRIVESIDAWSRKKGTAKNPGGSLLRQCFEGNLFKKQDMYKITFKNGSSITALPLGDPDNLRGFRCNVLGIDEGLLISSNTINLVLKPFLAGGADVTKKQLRRRKEDRDIAAGKMREEDRVKFPSTSKMVILSSASYRWEELFDTYKAYLNIISPLPTTDLNAVDADGKKKETIKRETLADGGISTYLVQQLSYKVAKEELMEPAILKEIKEKLIPDSVIRREYEAQFIDESGGYFSAKEMNKCTIPHGLKPCIELVGEKGAKYVLGIDPSMTMDPAGDHFAMCVMKIIKRVKDGREVGLVVHQYGCTGVELKHHIAYLYYLLIQFNIIYVVCDTTQGDASDFISVCNESEFFKQRKMALNPIEAEFTNEQFDEIIKQVQRSYNPASDTHRIVQKQYFSSPIIRSGNEHLRACFDQELVYFASTAQSQIDNTVSVLSHQDVMKMHSTHPEYYEQEGDGDMTSFVNYQDAMMDLVKKECALIELSSSALGNVSFDLPHHMTRNRKNINRVRKDSYTALWLAAWGLKIYLASQELPINEDDGSFAPVWAT